MDDGLNRRQLITSAAQSAASFTLGRFGRGLKRKPLGRTPRVQMEPMIAVVTNPDRAAAVREAVEKLGGIKAFVNKGDYVVLKPNMAWNREPGDAATTHPDTLRAVIELCMGAGAKDVLVMDHVIDRPADLVLENSGLKDAAESAGARIAAAQTENLYTGIRLPNGKCLTAEMVLRDVIRADVFINLPTAKIHSTTSVSLGMKNLMGTVWNPQAWHSGSSLHQCIADFSGAVKPDFTILDASRLLITNGPKGPGETRDVHQVIAGTDAVAVDAYGATLFGLDPSDVLHIRKAHECGVGEMDLEKFRVQSSECRVVQPPS
jgi:uncharacterized protein (DUF362 family)